jgi:DNA-binding Lrp family transcriptional regulator
MVKAVILLNTKVKSPKEQVLEKLKKIKGVNKVYNTSYGLYDYIAKVQTKTVAELKTNIIKRIQKLDAFISTTTLLIIQKQIRKGKN